MSYNLFLDDTREPVNAYLPSEKMGLVQHTGISDWVIVRDYRQFEFVLEKRGIPDVVSFDHDLHFEHVKHYMNETAKSGVIEYERFKHKTGKHCADLLVNKILVERHAPNPRCFVHSANEVGRDEIHKSLSRLARRLTF
jgi:hypothetical protein